VVDRAAGLLRRLTSNGDQLDNLLGAEGGRGPWPRGIGEHLLDETQQGHFGNRLLLGLLQLGSRLQPTVAPVAEGAAGSPQSPGRGLDAWVGR
jgi:hypothetical protein